MNIIEIEIASISMDAKKILEHKYDDLHKEKPYPIDRVIVCSESDPVIIAESLSKQIGADTHHFGMDLEKVTTQYIWAMKTDKPLIITVYDIDFTNFQAWIRYATSQMEGCVVIYKKFF